VGLGDLVELQLGGFCCSPGGFLALLTPKGVSLPPAQNLVERLRGAEPAGGADGAASADALLLALAVTRDTSDSDAPNSVAALTLLQLAQATPIDMGGAALPYDALAALTGDEEALLGAVIVAVAGDAAVPSAAAMASGSVPRGARRFEATLLAGGADTPGAYATGDAWLAVALALRCVRARRAARRVTASPFAPFVRALNRASAPAARRARSYAPYGARLFAAPAALAAAGVPLRECGARFGAAVSAADVAAQGSAVTDTLRRAFTAAARSAPGDRAD
jgi:hypothetical protein